jgi:hypothetical protein
MSGGAAQENWRGFFVFASRWIAKSRLSTQIPRLIKVIGCQSWHTSERREMGGMGMEGGIFPIWGFLNLIYWASMG